jgi:hypothetical protein
MTNGELFSQAARALVDESAVSMTTDEGRTLEVWTISSDGAAVRASAPRLEVREGMALSCRLMLDGLPHRIAVTVEQAEIQSHARAALVLRVDDVTVDGERRRVRRVDVSVAATLTALVCDRLVPGETLGAVLDDLSEGGMAVTVPDLRPRAGDRIRVRMRVFEGVLDSEVRVMSARSGDQPLTQVLGCAFLHPSADTTAIVTRMLARFDAAKPASAPLPGVREALGMASEPAQAPQRDQRPSPAPFARPGLA